MRCRATKTGRVLEPDKALAIIDDVVWVVAPFAFMRGAAVGFGPVIAAISGRFREPATDQEPQERGGKEVMSSTLLTLERPAGRRKDSELLNGHTGNNGAAPKVCFITREYPPNVYGGAGVHIKNLARELAQVMDVEVRCFGDQDLTEGRLRVKGYQHWGRMAEGAEQRFNSVLGTFSTDLSIVRDPLDAIVHAHTWYAAMAGLMAKELYDVPLAVTVHSLEPLRPWKEEQLGRSYRLSAWIERRPRGRGPRHRRLFSVEERDPHPLQHPAGARDRHSQWHRSRDVEALAGPGHAPSLRH